LAALLAGCGGGGGGGFGTKTLTVSVDYPNATASLYTSSTIQPRLDGFEGYEAHCGLTSGSMPAGMRLNDDCTISGRPTETGTFFFNFKVTAEDADGSANSSGTIRVAGPTPFYSDHPFEIGSSVKIGDAVTDLPKVDNINGWRAPTDGTALNWTYQLESGTLPPGLTLDAATGGVSGTATTTGDYGASLLVTLNSPYGTYTTHASYRLSVGLATLSYFVNIAGSGAVQESYITTFLSLPFKVTPYVGGHGTVSNFVASGVQLPAGLSLDPVTGVISGTPTSTLTGSLGPVSVTVAAAGTTYTSTARFNVSVNTPVLVAYPSTTVVHGTRISVAPTFTLYSSMPMPNITYAYDTTANSCHLPSGLTLDPSTGVINGTPTASGTSYCDVKVTITNNGTAWTEFAYLSLTVQ
jgi:hypothetical protein